METRKPRLVVINETKAGVESLVNLVNGVVKDGGAIKDAEGKDEDLEGTGLNWDITILNDVTDAEKIHGNSNALKGDVYCVREVKEDKTLAPRIAEVLKVRGKTGVMTLTTDGTREQPYDDTKKQDGYSLFNGWLPKDHDDEFNAGELYRKIEQFRERRLNKKGEVEKGELFQTFSLGILGLGTLGRALIKQIKSKPYVTQVHAFSNWALKDGYGEVITGSTFRDEKEQDKFEFHKSLEEVIEADPEILIIATGAHMSEYPEGEIADLTEGLLAGAHPKVSPMLQAIKDRNYQGQIFMESNAVGPLLQIAVKMGIDPSILSSITPDMARHRKHLLDILREKDPTLKISDIILGTIGEHSKEISRLREARVKGKLLTEVYPEFNDLEFRRQFNYDAQQIGINIVNVSKHLGDTYGGIPEIIVESLEDFAHFQRTNVSAYAYFPEEGCFSGGPAVIDYPLRVKSAARRMEDLSQDEEVMAYVRKTMDYQKALADKYYSKNLTLQIPVPNLPGTMPSSKQTPQSDRIKEGYVPQKTMENLPLTSVTPPILPPPISLGKKALQEIRKNYFPNSSQKRLPSPQNPEQTPQQDPEPKS